VLSDRFSGSTAAYQGYGRGLDHQLIEQLEAIATAGLQPDLTLWLDLPLAESLRRRGGRPADRIEAGGDGVSGAGGWRLCGPGGPAGLDPHRCNPCPCRGHGRLPERPAGPGAMSELFADLVGHDQARTLLLAALHRQRIAPAYLFAGPHGVGRRLAALRFLEGVLAGAVAGIRACGGGCRRGTTPICSGWSPPTWRRGSWCRSPRRRRPG
jgi:hypothetical protein